MLTEDKETFDRAIEDHDRAVAEKGLNIWLGAEPTFTDRSSEAPEWLYQAEGGDKADRALGMLACHSRDVKGPLVLRTIGRQYPGEELPRWNFGVYRTRNGIPAWLGPPDPVLGGFASPKAALERFPAILSLRLASRGWKNSVFANAGETGIRIVFRCDGQPPPSGGDWDERLQRPSIHDRTMPKEGLSDSLAEQGVYLIDIRVEPAGETGVASSERLLAPRLELPAFSSVEKFLACLEEISGAATEAGLSGLILAGYPPPVDRSIAWTTFTPDPAVVEVNMAPSTNAAEFLREVRAIYRCAFDQGLSAYRFYYNGDVTDSGGGGQITFGGPTPQTSPFFVKPWLLPNIIRYFNRHPALSYFFTPTCAGSSSQSPRPDERFRESFEELKLELDLLARKDDIEPEILWASLAPFLTDTSGNSHRTEINVEKLWNNNLIGRGCLGLVEFRAFRMAALPEILAARAVLFRAIIAMLAASKDLAGLTDWGAELHDRFALPYYLKQDLLEVLKDLTAAGLGLGAPLVELLLDDSDRLLGLADISGCRLAVYRALEFWPLAGDSASQELVTSRLVDSSTSRLQFTLRPTQERSANIRGWSVGAGGWRIPVRHESDAEGPVLIFGLRYRAFMPWNGLHPTLRVQTPVELTLHHDGTGETFRIVLHEWKPQAGGYDGLPADWEESRQRRSERLVAQREEAEFAMALKNPPPTAVTSYCLDLRACPGPEAL